MKKLNIFFAVLLAFFSCTSEVDVIPEIDSTPDADYTEVTFSLQVPGHKTPIVYAASDVDENLIKEIDVLAFAKKGHENKDTLAYRISVGIDQITNDASGINKKKIKAYLKRSESDLKLIFIANAKTVLDGLSIHAGDYMEDVMENLVFDYNGKWETSPMTGFPMWGQSEGYVNVKNSTVSTPLNIVLMRSVAKVDVGIDINGDPAIGFGSRFKLKHVYVYQPNGKGNIVPKMTDSSLSQNKVSVPNIPKVAAPIELLQEYEATDNKCFSEIYLPESKENQTFLIIGGVFDGGKETYYRIDFVNKNNQSMYLLRNYRYLVNITNVERDGFSTKEEAINARSSHIEYKLNVENENIKSIIYNGQYMLGVEDNKIKLDWKESTANTISVVTDYSNGWSATADVPWITLNTSSGGASGTINYNVQRNYDIAAIVRTGRIKVTAGSLSQEIIVSQSLGANCVIVKPNGKAEIPVIFANAGGSNRVKEGETLTTKILLEVGHAVVQAVSVTNRGKEGIINFEAGAGNGSVVVALENGEGVLWSWHVWVTDYDPDKADSQKSYNGTVFMDRNLGAGTSLTTPGLFYQWGRKDPFPKVPSEYVTIESVNQALNLENAIKNPTTFYTSDQYPWYSWYGLDETNNRLWVDEEGNKTVYDPCPYGWRVPVDTKVWSGATISSSELNPGLGRYTTTGYISFSDGQLWGEGTHGYYWTANPSGVKANAMKISATEISINSSPYRANGNLVRCVKE